MKKRLLTLLMAAVLLLPVIVILAACDGDSGSSNAQLTTVYKNFDLKKANIGWCEATYNGYPAAVNYLGADGETISVQIMPGYTLSLDARLDGVPVTGQYYRRLDDNSTACELISNVANYRNDAYGVYWKYTVKTTKNAVLTLDAGNLTGISCQLQIPTAAAVGSYYTTLNSNYDANKIYTNSDIKTLFNVPEAIPADGKITCRYADNVILFMDGDVNGDLTPLVYDHQPVTYKISNTDYAVYHFRANPVNDRIPQVYDFTTDGNTTQTYAGMFQLSVTSQFNNCILAAYPTDVIPTTTDTDSLTVWGKLHSINGTPNALTLTDSTSKTYTFNNLGWFNSLNDYRYLYVGAGDATTAAVSDEFFQDHYANNDNYTTAAAATQAFVRSVYDAELSATTILCQIPATVHPENLVCQLIDSTNTVHPLTPTVLTVNDTQYWSYQMTAAWLRDNHIPGNSATVEVRYLDSYRDSNLVEIDLDSDYYSVIDCYLNDAAYGNFNVSYRQGLQNYLFNAADLTDSTKLQLILKDQNYCTGSAGMRRDLYSQMTLTAYNASGAVLFGPVSATAGNMQHVYTFSATEIATLKDAHYVHLVVSVTKNNVRKMTFALNPTDGQQQLLLPDNKTIYYTTDNGQTWFNLNTTGTLTVSADHDLYYYIVSDDFSVTSFTLVRNDHTEYASYLGDLLFDDNNATNIFGDQLTRHDTNTEYLIRRLSLREFYSLYDENTLVPVSYTLKTNNL